MGGGGDTVRVESIGGQYGGTVARYVDCEVLNGSRCRGVGECEAC